MDQCKQYWQPLKCEKNNAWISWKDLSEEQNTDYQWNHWYQCHLITALPETDERHKGLEINVCSLWPFPITHFIRTIAVHQSQFNRCYHIRCTRNEMLSRCNCMSSASIDNANNYYFILKTLDELPHSYFDRKNGTYINNESPIKVIRRSEPQ